MRLFIIIINLLLITYPLYSADNSGTTSVNFLKIGTSSRYLARGEAFTALVDDPSALTVNPAGLATMDKMELLFSHYEWLLDLDYEHLAMVKPAFKGLYKFQGVMGFGLTYLHLPSWNHYDMWGDNVGKLDYNDLAFITGYGQQIYSFDVGLSLKAIRQQVQDVVSYSFGSDIGMIYTYKLPKNFLWLNNTYGKSIKTALVVQNIGSGIKGYSMPTTIKFGMGSEIMNDFQIELDVEQPLDSRTRLNFGMEYNIRNYLNLRAGYRFFGYKVDSFTMGIGIRYPFDNKLVKIDGAYAPEGVLRNTADLTFGIKFPGIDMEKEWRIANTLYYKGIYYYTNGKLKKAIELWKEALKHNPGHKKAKEKIKDAEYLLKLKEVEKDVKDEYKEGIDEKSK